MRRQFIFSFLILLSICSKGQSDSLRSVHLNRKLLLAGGTTIFAGSSLVYLHKVWYRPYNTGRFHFFDDNRQWLQMDKAGHVFSGYQTSRLMMEAFDWAGYGKNSRLYFGGAAGLFYLSVVEVMDGFSRGWGFSWGDQISNISGALFAVGQQALWEEQKFTLKFSYFPSGLAKYNPVLLGETAAARILKDYNAQTYWLSFSPLVFARNEWHFPQWLNIAAGYSAYGMTGGSENFEQVLDGNGNAIYFTRERIFLLSVDIDLTKIKTRSRLLRSLFSVINILKLPAPAIGVGKTGLHFYPVK